MGKKHKLAAENKILREQILGLKMQCENSGVIDKLVEENERLREQVKALDEEIGFLRKMTKYFVG